MLKTIASLAAETDTLEDPKAVMTVILTTETDALPHVKKKTTFNALINHQVAS